MVSNRFWEVVVGFWCGGFWCSGGFWWVLVGTGGFWWVLVRFWWVSLLFWWAVMVSGEFKCDFGGVLVGCGGFLSFLVGSGGVLVGSGGFW